MVVAYRTGTTAGESIRVGTFDLLSPTEAEPDT
jgi:hypothetical protein